LTTDADIDNAPQRSMQHWRPIRDALDAAGAPPATLDAIEALVPEAHRDGQTLAVVADAGGVLLSRNLPDPPARDIGRFAPLPTVAPLLEWQQRTLPHVVVLADR
jgi:hypothetical protein